MELAALESMGWSDVELASVAWDASGRDVVLRLRLPGNTHARVLVCRWAEALVMNLTFPEGRGGYPMTWDGAIARLPDGRWSVALDFASGGELRLVCAEVEIREESELERFEVNEPSGGPRSEVVRGEAEPTR